MMLLLAIPGLALVALGLLYHFLALETFNLLVPKDGEARRIASGIAYGAGPRQKLDLYAPRAPETGPWPVVVFVHGGSWSSGNKNAYAFVGRALAAQGFLALVISYRLHPRHPYPAFVEDTAQALAWATRHAAEHGGDTSALFALGHSAGAYNVAQAVLDMAHFEKLGIAAPPLRAVATLAGPFDFLPLDSPISTEVFGRVPNLPATQPINHAGSHAPEFLILHGAADTTCLPRNSISLDQSLREAGAKSTLKIYDGIGHAAIMLAMAKPLRHMAPTLEDVTGFFRSRL
ncbi:MAG: alpha/beta hydrolase [Alphaproteobacteria bacterium]|nr:alpha/beta hydrolase [Alphaproteobacteria bacterium]